MKDDLLERLIWDDRDGEITPEDRERLAELRRRQPGSERLQREVAALAEILGTIPPVEPNDDLAARIKSAVAERAVASRPAPPRVRRGLPRWAERCAALAAGILLGVVAYHLVLVGRPGGSSARFSGSVATVQPLAGSPAMRVSLGDAGELAVIRTDGAVGLEAALRPDRSARIELLPAAGEVALLGLASWGTGEWRATQGRGLVLEGTAGGRMRLDVRVPEDAWPLALRVSSGGAVVVDRRLTRGAVPIGSTEGTNSEAPAM